MLRFVSPIKQFARLDRTTAQQTIVWFGAANRDSSVFVDSHRLDLARAPNPHLAFGAGPHRCPGAPIALLALRLVLARFPSMTLVGEPVRKALAVPPRPRKTAGAPRLTAV
jgi:cytochrome P450